MASQLAAEWAVRAGQDLAPGHTLRCDHSDERQAAVDPAVSSPGRILIVEDDADSGDYLRRGLSYEGYQSHLLAAAEVALAAWQTDEPRVVILDLMLPGMDGLLACPGSKTRAVRRYSAFTASATRSASSIMSTRTWTRTSRLSSPGRRGYASWRGLLIDRRLILDDAYSKLLNQQNAPLLEEMRLVARREMMHEVEVDRQLAVTEAEARIRTIRLYLGQADNDRRRAWQRAQAAYQALVPGLGGEPQDFDAVAREYDEAEQDPADPGRGEWVRMGDDVLRNPDAHPIHTYLLNLSVDPVSQPFEFADSVYRVKILERSEPVPLTIEQVDDYIRAELEACEHERLDGELVARLLRDTNFTVYKEVLMPIVDADQAAPAGQPAR